MTPVIQGFFVGKLIPSPLINEQPIMPIQRIITKGKVPVKIYTDDVDPQALTQLTNIAQLPFIHSHVAAMPDVHVGIGATVGAVIPTKGAIIPAAVGVDIGCGMNAVRLSLKASQLPDNLRPLRAAVEAVVPVGFAMHQDKPGVPASAVRLSPRAKYRSKSTLTT